MKKVRIILVENDEDEQFFMKEGFEKSGYFDIILQTENGDALLEWLRENPGSLPDVILSDLNMSGKNGYDIINEIKNTPEYHHIPVIITSTSSTHSIIKKCLDQGAADYLVKPETFIDYKDFAKKLYTHIIEKHLVN